MISAEESRDQLEAMLRQESKYYQCVDYLDTEEPELVCSPLHVVEECALLVTDIRHIPVQPKEDKLLQSPSKVNKFPSPHTSANDLYAMTESLRSSSSSRPAVELSYIHSWRHQMLEWAYTVAESFSVDREVVAVAFSILDRYVAIELEREEESPISREDFTLYAMVSMYIAVKNIVPFRKLTVDTIMDMSRGFYSARDVISKEQDILTSLNWHVNPPTVIDFCRLYMRLFPGRLPFEVEAIGQYIAELALDDVYFIAKSSSRVALATVLLATQRSGVSVKHTHGFLQNLRGTVNIESSEFDSIHRRLDCLC